MLKNALLATTFLFAANAVSSAADLLPTTKGPPPAPAVYNWTGFYAGVNAGGAFGSFDPITATIPGSYFGPANSAAVNAAGVQRIDPAGFTGGAQIGYNWQVGRFVGGLEADFNYLHLNGAANSGAVPYPGIFGYQFVVSSYANSDWLFTLRPRIGFAADNWLFYGTGGLAVTNLRTDFVFTDQIFGSLNAVQSALVNTDKLGYAIGGGVEWGLTDQLSLKAEYLHVGFDRTAAKQTGSNIPTQPFYQSADLSGDIVRVGLNYRLGDPNASSSSGAPAWPAPSAFQSDWEFDVGTRTWLSSGKVGAPEPLFYPPPASTLASRIVFTGLDAWSGETYARVDHSSGLFVKGFLGAGGITGGKQNDEDFPPLPASHVYSNTLSSASGNLGYADIDAGYAFLKSPAAKFGAFVGYNYYTDHINSYGCTQIAASYDCSFLPQGVDGLTQSDTYNSLRLGLSSQFMLTERLKFTADAAYLPWVNFRGVDNHNFRELLLPEKASQGDGTMLEASLDYKITDNWSVGAGARYWAWSMQNGAITFDFLGHPPPFNEPARYNAERYGVFLESDYHFGDATVGGATASEGSTDAGAPTNWTGIFAGGHLGGGWSDAHWSDPFPSTKVGPETNIAGFGDSTHATGPLAGGQVGANWQTGHWVVGLEAEGDWAGLRGENTCFSGLGGINCQHIVASLFDLAGRGGFAWDRSLLYAKAGGAWASTRYNLYGDTNALALGVGGAGVTTPGWLAGGGLEYALSDKWSTTFEYDHIGLDRATPSFPTVPVVNAAHVGIRESVDVFKLGLNYKLF
jgi:opacity protein-like surface antigen